MRLSGSQEPVEGARIACFCFTPNIDYKLRWWWWHENVGEAILVTSQLNAYKLFDMSRFKEMYIKVLFMHDHDVFD